MAEHLLQHISHLNSNSSQWFEILMGLCKQLLIFSQFCECFWGRYSTKTASMEIMIYGRGKSQAYTPPQVWFILEIKGLLHSIPFLWGRHCCYGFFYPQLHIAWKGRKKKSQKAYPRKQETMIKQWVLMKC